MMNPMGDKLSAAEIDRIHRLLGIEKYHESIATMIDDLHGYAAHKQWRYTRTDGGGAKVSYAREDFVFEYEIKNPIEAINVKLPLEWDMSLRYQGEVISSMVLSIVTKGNAELWSSLSHMTRLNRSLFRRASIYLNANIRCNKTDHIKLMQTLNSVEYKAAKTMAHGLFALFTHDIDMSRKTL